jgi:hypothetical protein
VILVRVIAYQQFHGVEWNTNLLNVLLDEGGVLGGSPVEQDRALLRDDQMAASPFVPTQ